MQLSIFDGTEQSLLNTSLTLIREFEHIALARNPRGYVVGYSGGKDSDVLVHLFKRSGVDFCVVHNHTTIDTPETVYYIRRKFAEWEAQGIPCKIYYPARSFWQLCREKNMLPLRQVRFCCAELKERQIPELYRACRSFGVRKAESARRKLHRDSIETRNREDYKDVQRFHFDDSEKVQQSGACYVNNYFFINPLAYWSDDYLWGYIESEKVEINPLYGCGYKRVGCLMCPMAKIQQRRQEAERYPAVKRKLIRLCDDLIEYRNATNHELKNAFKSGQEYFDWWLSDESLNAGNDFDLFNL